MGNMKTPIPNLMATPRKSSKIIEIHTGVVADFYFFHVYLRICWFVYPPGQMVCSKTLSRFCVVLLLRTQEAKLL